MAKIIESNRSEKTARVPRRAVLGVFIHQSYRIADLWLCHMAASLAKILFKLSSRSRTHSTPMSPSATYSATQTARDWFASCNRPVAFYEMETGTVPLASALHDNSFAAVVGTKYWPGLLRKSTHEHFYRATTLSSILPKQASVASAILLLS